MDEKEIYQAALDNWGYESQIDMMIEECAELIDALQKLKRLDSMMIPLPDAGLE